MRKTLTVAAIVFIACGSLAAWGSTWYVDGAVSEPGDGTSAESAFKTIQEGINAASDGDMVVVEEGIYAENIAFGGKNIVLRGMNPADPTAVENTIIDGSRAGPVVTFTGTESQTCVLSGFTIRNGSAEKGGGICGGTLIERTHATIGNNVIIGNTATSDGGGLAYCDGFITGNTISNNVAERDGGGLSRCNGTIRNNAISNNRGNDDGGGLFNCDGIVQGNVVSGNIAGDRGGGFFFCNGIIEGNMISGNSAGSYGGGLWFCHGTIRNNLISANRAGNAGGVGFCFGAIRNNTIVMNHGGTGGGLGWCYGTISNCIIWGNAPSSVEQIGESSPPGYSCIQGWTGVGTNIADDPRFVDPDGPDDDPETYEDNDYRLSADSPCIDAGRNEDWMWDAVDPDGNPRILHGVSFLTVDMGVYEYSSSPIEDTRPPYVWDVYPAPDATHAPISTNIVLHVRDHGDGVDETSIVMTVSGLEVTPTVSGTAKDYIVSYKPPSDLPYSQKVTVTVDAADLFSPANVMEQVTYSFTTTAEPVPEATWYVGGSAPASGDGTSWETAFIAIQEGIDAAYDGDTVIVAEGVYEENITLRGANIVLRSTQPTDRAIVEKTAIDGRGAGPVVTFAGTEDQSCVLSGFMIQRGKADTGGGICGGTPDYRSRATIENNIITANSATRDGGGVSLCDGTIRNNEITGNSAGINGGGLSYCNGSIQGNAISDNSAAADFGGGLYRCDGTVQKNSITGNSAYQGAGLAACDGLIVGNSITGNSAVELGGGLRWCNGTIQNNTICRNTVDSGGGGLALCDGLIRNCIIWGNSSPQLFDSGNPNHSCIQDWAGGGEGNIAEDPRFVKGGYRLKAGSPCIDAGMNEDWMQDAVDLDGNPRIWAGTVDMGAYEYGSFPFKITQVLPTLTWISRPGDTYTVQSCFDLSSGVWDVEETIPSQGESTTWSDPDMIGPQKFYRIGIE